MRPSGAQGRQRAYMVHASSLVLLRSHRQWHHSRSTAPVNAVPARRACCAKRWQQRLQVLLGRRLPLGASVPTMVGAMPTMGQLGQVGSSPSGLRMCVRCRTLQLPLCWAGAKRATV